jgi:hypothetical protein
VRAPQPFAGLLDPVLVRQPLPFPSTGCIVHEDAAAAWRCVVRDLCPDLIAAEILENGAVSAAELEAVMGAVAIRIHDAITIAETDQEAARRLRAQLGGEAGWKAFPMVLVALRGRSLVAKAQALGRVINSITDDAALGSALGSLPLGNSALAGLLFHALLAEVGHPGRLMTSAVKLSGGAGEGALVRTGFAPLVDAHFAHAQVQVLSLQPLGGFADMDLACRRLERYHRLLRSLTANMEFARASPWSATLSGTVRMATERVEGRLREVVLDINAALRRGREGSDRLDADRLLAAINGVYLLAAIRDCRGSLALNALFDQAWTQSGEALELHLKRNLELLQAHPADSIIAARLDGAIAMAEIRFNSAYAETLRRARATAERRG